MPPFYSHHSTLLVSASAQASLAYAISAEPLSFIYGCQAWDEFRPLLRFLALIRHRAKQATLVLAPGALPFHLLLIHLPNEIAHEIFADIFASLVEERKLDMLDYLGPCPHGGFCPGPADLDGHDTLTQASFDHGRKDMREWRRKLLAQGDPGMCFVDHLGVTDECSPSHHEDHQLCDERRDKIGLWAMLIWDAEMGKLAKVMLHFGLHLLSRPGPTYSLDLADDDGQGGPQGNIEHLVARPALVGLPLPAPVKQRIKVTVDRTFGNELDVSDGVRIGTPRSLTAQERNRFSSVARSLRLVPPSESTVHGSGEADSEDATERTRTGSLIPALTIVTHLEGVVENLH